MLLSWPEGEEGGEDAEEEGVEEEEAAEAERDEGLSGRRIHCADMQHMPGMRRVTVDVAAAGAAPVSGSGVTDREHVTDSDTMQVCQRWCPSRCVDEVLWSPQCGGMEWTREWSPPSQPLCTARVIRVRNANLAYHKWRPRTTASISFLPSPFGCLCCGPTQPCCLPAC